MSKEVIEQEIRVVSEEIIDNLIKMSEAAPFKSVMCDDKGLLLENQKDPCDSSTTKKSVQNNTEEDYNKEKDTLLNCDFENNTKIIEQNDINEENEKNNTAENEKKVRDDYKNKQLMDIDNVEKSINDAKNDISVKIDDENNDNTQVEEKPLENPNPKEKNDQLMEIDNVEKSIEYKRAENNIPTTINNEKNDEARENLKQNDNSENENDCTDDEKIKTNKNEEVTLCSTDKIHLEVSKHIMKFLDPMLHVDQNNINEDEGHNNTADKHIIKLQEVDNVSIFGILMENDDPMMDDKNDDCSQFVEKLLENAKLKANNKGDKDETFTDAEKSENEEKPVSQKAEELELGENMIEGAPKPKDKEQTSEYGADKILDEQKLCFIKIGDASEEDIEKNEVKPADNVVKQVDLAEGNDNLDEQVQKKINNLNEKNPADEQEIFLVQSNDNSEKDIQKKRKNKHEEKPVDNVDEEVDLVEDIDNPGKYIHKKKKIN